MRHERGIETGAMLGELVEIYSDEDREKDGSKH